MVDKAFKALGVAILGVLNIAFAALIGGTLVYWLWPVVMPELFPDIHILTWGQAVCLSWLANILIKPMSISNVSRKPKKGGRK